MLNGFKRTVILLSGTALIALTGPAYALDGDDFTSKLSAAIAAQSGSLTASETDVDGSTVTLKGVVFAPKSDPEKKLQIGDVTFEGVEESDLGYTVDLTTFNDIDVSEKGAHVTVADIEINGLRVPADTTSGALNSFLLYDKFSTGPINIERDGKSVVKIEATDATIDIGDDVSSMDVRGEISGIEADLTSVPDPKSKAIIEALNLENLYGNVVMSGTWDAKTGRVDLNEYSLDARDVGKLNIALSLSGYTTDFIKAMQQAQTAMASNPDKQAGNQAFGMAMMGLMQQLTFNSASVRFDDASITKRALDFAGRQQGVSGDQMAQMLKAMAPMMMARFNMPDLQAQVSAALNAYLDDPQSIEIKAEPAQPVAVPMIMGTAMGSPQTLPNVLGVTVTANQ